MCARRSVIAVDIKTYTIFLSPPSLILQKPSAKCQNLSILCDFKADLLSIGCKASIPQHAANFKLCDLKVDCRSVAKLQILQYAAKFEHYIRNFGFNFKSSTQSKGALTGSLNRDTVCNPYNNSIKRGKDEENFSDLIAKTTNSYFGNGITVAISRPSTKYPSFICKLLSQPSLRCMHGE